MFMVETFYKWDRVNGNSYHGCTITTADRQRQTFTTDHDSNVRAGLFDYFGGWENVSKHVFESDHGQIPAREYNRKTKDVRHLGCSGSEIAAILTEIYGPAPAE